MSQKKFQVPAILESFSTRKDRGASIRFSANELSDEDFLILKQFQGNFGFLLFKENEYSLQDIPREDAPDISKSPAKRLRAALFVLHMQRGGTKENFEPFYLEQMEKVITHVKNKLD